MYFVLAETEEGFIKLFSKKVGIDDESAESSSTKEKANNETKGDVIAAVEENPVLGIKNLRKLLQVNSSACTHMKEQFSVLVTLI